MLIVMRHGAADEEIQRVVPTIVEMGYQARPMPGKQRRRCHDEGSPACAR